MMRIATLALVSCLFLHVQSASVSQQKRELSGKEIIGGEEFFFGTEQVGWHDAATLCQDAGMRLATLNTEERWNMIADFVFDNSALIGTNGSDLYICTVEHEKRINT